MANPHNPRQNHILAALPATEFKRISPHLELSPMPLGDSYFESGELSQQVYFPVSAILSLHYVMENGTHAEIAGVGNEGMLGVSLLAAGNGHSRRASVRMPGYSYKMKSKLLLEVLQQSSILERQLQRYIKALISQEAHTAVCNRYHSVEQKLCRWLLLNIDRLSGHKQFIPQNLLASMLGEQRHTVAEVLRNLQQIGLIIYHCEHIIIVYREELEKRACGCYDVLKHEFNRLLGLEWERRPVKQQFMPVH